MLYFDIVTETFEVTAFQDVIGKLFTFKRELHYTIFKLENHIQVHIRLINENFPI